jgi:hypothetical protein
MNKPAFTIDNARAMAKEKNLNRLIILYQESDGTLNGVSYGRNRQICQETGKLLDKYFDDICNAL